MMIEEQIKEQYIQKLRKSVSDNFEFIRIHSISVLVSKGKGVQDRFHSVDRITNDIVKEMGLPPYDVHRLSRYKGCKIETSKNSEEIDNIKINLLNQLVQRFREKDINCRIVCHVHIESSLKLSYGDYTESDSFNFEAYKNPYYIPQ